MKIANIILSSQNGGAEQVFIDYIRVLKNLNHQLLAITKTDAPYKDKVLEMGVELKTINNHFGFHDIFAIRNIRKILEEFDADIVIAHVGRSMVLVRKALNKNKKTKLIAVNHSSNVKRSIGSDLIFSVNKEIFFKTIDLGQDEAKTFVIPNATDVSDANDEMVEIDLLNKAKITLGSLGRFDKAKGFDMLIQALKLLKNSGKNFTLKLAGSGKEEENLRKLACDLGLENDIEFCGWIKNKKDFFSQLDIFCMSSTDGAGETFGLVLLEAMKYRTPIVSSNADGPKDILRDEVDALIFDVRKQNREQGANEMKQKILRLCEEKNLATKLVENAYQRLMDKYTYAALEKRFIEVFGRAK